MMATLEATAPNQDATLLLDHPLPFAGDHAGADYFCSD